MVAIAYRNPDGTPSGPDLRLVAECRRVSPRVLRRRRQAAAALCSALLLVVGVAIGGLVASQSRISSHAARVGSTSRQSEPSDPVMGPSTRVSHTVHIVQPGETVWSIARQWQPSGEVRPLVDRLVTQQHGRALQPGDRIVLR